MPENRATRESSAEAALKSADGMTVAGSDEASAKAKDEKHGQNTLGHTKGAGANLAEIASSDEPGRPSK